MELTPTASPGAQRSRLLQLEGEVKEKEENLMQAAMYGKMLLEENTDLQTRIETLMKQHATVLEDKQQELCSLNSRLEIVMSTEKWHQEEMANLRSDLQTIRDQVEEEKRQEIATHKKQVESLRVDVDHLQSVEQDLRGQVGELEALLQTHLDRTLTPLSTSTSASFSSAEDMAALTEELCNLRMDLTEAQAKSIELSSQLQESQREKDTLMSRLKAASVDMDDLQSEAAAYSRHLEESRKEVLELRAQLDASRVDGQFHQSKGNSIFSELEDRRLVLEKKMASLKIQNEQLVEKYSIEKQQNSKYKMQIAMGLEMTSQKEDPTAQRLRAQLSEAHAEIRTLIDRLQQLEDSKEMVVSGVGDGGDQFIMATLQLEKEKLSKAQSELQAKTLQYLDVSQQNVELTRKHRQLEAENGRLRGDMLKLVAQKEEMLLKYEPDKMKQGKLQEKIVEKIDMGDPLFHGATLATSGRPSDLFRPCPPSGRPSNVFTTSRPPPPPSSSSSLPVSGRPSDAFRLTSDKVDALKPLNHIQKSSHVSEHAPFKLDMSQTTPLQKENVGDTEQRSAHPLVLPSGRSVRMAEEVKVIYADGDDSLTSLSQEGEGSSKPLKKQRPAAKPVKYIKAEDAPEANCKTQ